MTLRVFLLAAGFGSRLRPLTDTTPKCAVPINGKPLVHYWYDQLSALKVDAFLVNTHYLPKKVEAAISDLPLSMFEKTNISYESELLGTAGSLLKNIDFLEQSDTVLIAHADNLCICDFEAFLNAHNNRPSDSLMTMMLFRTPTPESCGVVALGGDGCVLEFHEKVKNPPSNLANGAVYLMDKMFFKWLSAQTDLPSIPDISLDIIPKLMGKIFTWENQNYHRDIGTPESYQRACIDMANLTTN